MRNSPTGSCGSSSPGAESHMRTVESSRCRRSSLDVDAHRGGPGDHLMAWAHGFVRCADRRRRGRARRAPSCCRVNRRCTRRLLFGFLEGRHQPPDHDRCPRARRSFRRGRLLPVPCAPVTRARSPAWVGGRGRTRGAPPCGYDGRSGPSAAVVVSSAVACIEVDAATMPALRPRTRRRGGLRSRGGRAHRLAAADPVREEGLACETPRAAGAFRAEVRLQPRRARRSPEGIQVAARSAARRTRPSYRHRRPPPRPGPEFGRDVLKRRDQSRLVDVRAMLAHVGAGSLQQMPADMQLAGEAGRNASHSSSSPSTGPNAAALLSSVAVSARAAGRARRRYPPRRARCLIGVAQGRADHARSRGGRCRSAARRRTRPDRPGPARRPSSA